MSASNLREVKEGLQPQGIDEMVRYSIDTLPYGAGAVAPLSLTVFDEKDWTDKTANVTTGSTTIAGSVITTAILQNLRLHVTYHCRLGWSLGSGQSRSAYFRVRGER